MAQLTNRASASQPVTPLLSDQATKVPAPGAENLAANLDALAANGHSYLDPMAQVALSSGGQSPQQTVAIANRIKSSIKSNTAIVDHYYADAQQNRLPSVTQQITTQLHSLVGPKLFTEDHVSTLQQQMQKAGLGKGLPVNGVWTPEWQNAAMTHRVDKIHEPGVGNADSKSTVRSVLDFLYPSHVANFLINTVKALPRETLQMMGDVVYLAGSGGTDPELGKAIAQAFAKPENRTTTKEYMRQATSGSQVLQDLGTLLSFLPVGRLISGVVKTSVESHAAGVAAKSAEKTSAIGKVLGKSSLTALTPLETVAPKYTILNSIVASAKTGTPSLIHPSSRALINKPILGWMYAGLNKVLPPVIDKAVVPVIAKTAPMQMFVRDNLAQRLRLPIVKATNEIGLKATGAAVGLGAIAVAESKTGGREGPLDSTVYGLGPIQGPLAAALDIWGMQMNPGRMQARQVLGSTGATGEALRDTFLDTGVLHAWINANPDLDYPTLVAKYGEQAVAQHIADQLNQTAAHHAVDYLLSPMKTDPNKWAKMTGPQKEELLVKTKQDVWRKSVERNSDLNQSYEHLIASMNDMETGFRNQVLDALQSTKKLTAKDKVAFTQGITRTGSKIEANQILGELLAKHSKYIIHPGTLQELRKQTESLAGTDPFATRVSANPLDELQPLTNTQRNQMMGLLKAQGLGKREDRLAYASKIVGRTLTSQNELTQNEAANVIAALRGKTAGPPLDLSVLDAGWVEANNPQAPQGMIGMMRKEGMDAQANKVLVTKLRAKLENADTPALQDEVRSEVIASLLGDHGLDIYKLGEHSTDELINVLEDQTGNLAHRIYLVKDAPQEAKDLLEALDAVGYKMVAGQDIGHVFTPGLQRTFRQDYQKSKTATWASRLGVSPAASDSAAVGARTRVETLIEIQKRIDNGSINALPGFNASRLLAFLRAELPKHVELTPGQSAVLGIGKHMGNYDLKIAELTKDGKMTSDEAWTKITQAKKTELGLREIMPEQLKAALTTKIPNETADLMGLDHGTPFLDSKSADQFIQALWLARTKVPSEMIGGIAKLEDWIYAGFGVGGKSFPGVNAISQAPARFYNLRNRVRFQESPIFAYRRMFKTAAKGITENIPPTLYPEAKMVEMGISKKADAIFRRVFPEYNEKNAFLDDAERIIAEGDLWNLYSPRDYYRWGSYWLSKQGYTDEQIYQKMTNVMHYGERTAAERSLNAVFYPFSFNKTVMRQFGAFLLTHPGQRTMLATLMDQYDKHSGPDVLKWFEDHAPLIKQFEKLNALEHGLGLGQFGGINTPYIQGLGHFLTMLGPKKIDYGTTEQNDTTLAVLKQYIPALQEFVDLFVTTKNGNRVGGQVGETYGNLWDQAGAALDKYVKHTPETDWSPVRHSSMSYNLQQSQGWEYRTRLITMLSKVLDYNYANPDARKVWPTWVPQETGLWGKPITKASIGELVHYKYPQWDNTKLAVMAQRKATEVDRFIGEVSAKNPTLGATYRLFNDKAVSLSDAVGRDAVKPDKLAVITDAFRHVAIQLATQDANFADFYKTHYERLFGPLEAFKP